MLASQNMFGKIPSLLVFQNNLRIHIGSSVDVLWNSAVRTSGARFFFDGRLSITDSILLHIIGQFRGFVLFWYRDLNPGPCACHADTYAMSLVQIFHSQ